MSDTVYGMTSTVIGMFRSRHPDLNVSSEVRDGEERFQVIVPRSVHRRAVAGNACECTLARATVNATNFADVFASERVLYGLADDGFVYKFMHDGYEVVKALDSGQRLGMDRVLNVRPPAPSRRVGAQSAERRSNPPTGARGPQSTATKEKRAAALAQTVNRYRIATNYLRRGRDDAN